MRLQRLNIVDATAQSATRTAVARSAVLRTGVVRAPATGGTVAVTVREDPTDPAQDGVVQAGYPVDYAPVVDDVVVLLVDRDRWVVLHKMASAPFTPAPDPAAPRYGLTTSDLSVPSNALIAVPAMSLTVEAGATYELRMVLYHKGAQGADLRYQLTYPNGAGRRLQVADLHHEWGATTISDPPDWLYLESSTNYYTSVPLGTMSATTAMPVLVQATYTVGDTSGTLSTYVAQFTDTPATPSTLLSGSYLRLQRMR
jgi:hypothetical protein